MMIEKCAEAQSVDMQKKILLCQVNGELSNFQ